MTAAGQWPVAARAAQQARAQPLGQAQALEPVWPPPFWAPEHSRAGALEMAQARVLAARPAGMAAAGAASAGPQLIFSPQARWLHLTLALEPELAPASGAALLWAQARVRAGAQAPGRALLLVAAAQGVDRFVAARSQAMAAPAAAEQRLAARIAPGPMARWPQFRVRQECVRQALAELARPLRPASARRCRPL